MDIKVFRACLNLIILKILVYVFHLHQLIVLEIKQLKCRKARQKRHLNTVCTNKFTIATQLINKKRYERTLIRTQHKYVG